MSVLFVANLWKKLMVWAVCVRYVHRTLDRFPAPAGARRPGTPCRRRGSEFKGFFYVLPSGADFRARRRRTVRSADLRALEVFGRVVHKRRGSRTRPPGGDFEAVVDRLLACYAARTRRQKEINQGPDCAPVMTTRREEGRFTMIHGLGNVNRARPSPH
jgi:hypothetical protein